MARRRSKTSATGANMDSLLDALTNVVGILVIVLVAVQISSQEAARRMEEMIAQIDPAEQERIKQAAADSESKLKEMELALKSESEKDKIDPDKLLASLQDDIAAAELKAKKAQYSGREPGDRDKWRVEFIEQISRHHLPSRCDQREDADCKCGLLDNDTSIHEHRNHMGKDGSHTARSERDCRHQNPECPS